MRTDIAAEARIVHIVPSMPPEINGLGDYVHQLWRAWPEPKPEWHVAASRVPEGAAQAWPEVEIHGFQNDPESLTAVLGATGAGLAVLHYVGYAYAPRGAPMWLPPALAAWKAKSGGRLVVMFHEIYASGPPWRSEFWLNPLQRRVASQLLGLADRWVCSCPRQRETLVNKLRADLAIGSLIPVGSNIDPIREPDWDRPWPLSTGDKLKIVAFGQPITRLRSLKSHQNLLRELCRRDLVESILLLGKSGGENPICADIERLLPEIGCTELCEEAYDLPSAEISLRLLDQHLGLLSNSYGILTKSGVFAAYCVHGVLTVIPGAEWAPAGPFIRNSDSSAAECCEALTGKKELPELEAIKAFSAGLSWDTIASAWSAHIGSLRSEQVVAPK